MKSHWTEEDWADHCREQISEAEIWDTLRQDPVAMQIREEHIFENLTEDNTEGHSDEEIIALCKANCFDPSKVPAWLSQALRKANRHIFNQYDSAIREALTKERMAK